MANDWVPFPLQTTRSTGSPGFSWPSGSTPTDVDDQAPIPLIVGIGLALFIGFVIIVCCICRRRHLSSSSSGTQESNAVYQRAPTADGNVAGGGGFAAGAGANSYPMAPVHSKLYPPMTQGQQVTMGVSGQLMTGGMMTQGQQPSSLHPYPVLPPDAYTPPYPLGNSPLPAYMPTSLSSHTSSAPSSDHVPSGFSSSSPPAPAPAPTGMMARGTEPSVMLAGVYLPHRTSGPEAGGGGTEVGPAGGMTGFPYANHSHTGPGSLQGQGQGMDQSQGQRLGQGHGTDQGPGQGMGQSQGQEMLHAGNPPVSTESQRGVVGGGVIYGGGTHSPRT